MFSCVTRSFDGSFVQSSDGMRRHPYAQAWPGPDRAQTAPANSYWYTTHRKSSALYSDQRGFNGIAFEVLLGFVGFVFFVTRPQSHAVHGPPVLLPLGDPGLRAHQGQLGALLLGIFRRAKSTHLNKVVKRVRA